MDHSIPERCLPTVLANIGSFCAFYPELSHRGHLHLFQYPGDTGRKTLEELASLYDAVDLTDFATLTNEALSWLDKNKHLVETLERPPDDLLSLDQKLSLLSATQPEKRIESVIRQNCTFVGLNEKDFASHILELKSLHAPTIRASRWRKNKELAQRWCENPLNIGLSLIAGRNNRPCFARQAFGPGENLAKYFGEDEKSGSIRFVEQEGSEQWCDFSFIKSTGITVSPMDVTPKEGIFGKYLKVISKRDRDAFSPDIVKRPSLIKIEEIIRTQKLLRDFHVAEFIAEAWPNDGSILHMRIANLYEIPSWAPGKFWLRLITPDWAVKASPEKCTLVNPNTNEVLARLSQEELTKRISQFSSPA